MKFEYAQVMEEICFWIFWAVIGPPVYFMSLGGVNVYCWFKSCTGQSWVEAWALLYFWTVAFWLYRVLLKAVHWNPCGTPTLHAEQHLPGRLERWPMARRRLLNDSSLHWPADLVDVVPWLLAGELTMLVKGQVAPAKLQSAVTTAMTTVRPGYQLLPIRRPCQSCQSQQELERNHYYTVDHNDTLSSIRMRKLFSLPILYTVGGFLGLSDFLALSSTCLYAYARMLREAPPSFWCQLQPACDKMVSSAVVYLTFRKQQWQGFRHRHQSHSHHYHHTETAAAAAAANWHWDPISTKMGLLTGLVAILSSLLWAAAVALAAAESWTVSDRHTDSLIFLLVFVNICVPLSVMGLIPVSYCRVTALLESTQFDSTV